MEEKLIFISCGQQTEEEKRIGSLVRNLVNETPGFKAYFAEYVQSLEALATDIFDALRRCSGFIAFLHDRGKVIEKDGNEWGGDVALLYGSIRRSLFLLIVNVLRGLNFLFWYLGMTRLK